YDPKSVAVSTAGPEAGDIYVANNSSGTVSVIDPKTNTVVATINLGVGDMGQNFAGNIAVSPTGPEAGYIYVATGDGKMSGISAYTNAVVGTVNPNGYINGTNGVAVSPTTGDIYLTNFFNAKVFVIDPTTLNVIGTIDVPSTPTAVAVSPAGPYAGYVYV